MGSRPLRDPVTKANPNQVDSILRNDTRTWSQASNHMHLRVYTPTANRFSSGGWGVKNMVSALVGRQLCHNMWRCYMASCTRQQAGSKRQTASQIHPFFRIPFFNTIYYLFMCMCACLHEFMCATCVWEVEWALGPLEQELQVVVSHHVDVGNQARALCMSRIIASSWLLLSLQPRSPVSRCPSHGQKTALVHEWWDTNAITIN